MKVIKEYSSEEVIEGLQKDKGFSVSFLKIFWAIGAFCRIFLLEEGGRECCTGLLLKLWEKTDFPIFVILILIFCTS